MAMILSMKRWGERQRDIRYRRKQKADPDYNISTGTGRIILERKTILSYTYEK